MTEQPSLKRNIAYNTWYQMIVILIPLVTAPYISRVLGVEGVGIHSFTGSVQSYFSMFTALGTATYGKREIARFRENKEKTSKLFWEIELLTMFSGFVCLLPWAGLLLLSDSYQPYFIALTLSIFATMFDITWFFDGLEEFGRILLLNTVFKLLGVVFLFTLVRKQEDLLLYIWIYAATGLLCSVCSWGLLKPFLVSVNRRELQVFRHFRETFIYFMPTIATSIYLVLDKTLLGLMVEDVRETGYYEQANKVIGVGKAVTFAAINTAMMPRMSYLWGQGKRDEVKSLMANSMDSILFVGVGIAAGVSGVAKRFVPLFFGEGYEKVVTLLYLLAPVIVIIGISNCLECQYYTPSGQRSKSTKFVWLGAAVNLCLNLVLIPRSGAVGAITATLVAELLISALYVGYSEGYMTLSALFGKCYKRFLAGAVGLAVMLLEELTISNTWVCLGVQGVSFAVLYIGLLFALRDGLIKRIFSGFMSKCRHAKG